MNNISTVQRVADPYLPESECQLPLMRENFTV